MRYSTTTFVRMLALFTVTSLVGCDEPSVDDIDDIDELDELDDELRVVPLPRAGIPSDDPTVMVSFSIPLQPVAKFKPKSGYSLHGPTDLAYIYTPDPTGDPSSILVDSNGVSPYGENQVLVPQGVCGDFLEDYPSYVPVIPQTESCGAIEQGCCDHVCYLWGGTAIEDANHQNVTVAVNDDTFNKTEMVYGAYVDPGARMTWTMNTGNGGHSPREKVCGCSCTGVVP